MADSSPSGRQRLASALAAAVAIVVLVACIVVGGGAWRAWLGAAFYFASLSIGALGLMMIMRNIPGLWAREAMPALEAEALLAPVGALAFIPVLVALPAIYRWVGATQTTPFRQVWLTPELYILVTVAWFAVVFILAGLLVGRPEAPRAVSCIGLLLFAVLGTFAATHWVQSLDPDFNSSGFALYVICLQILQGLAGALVFALMGPGLPPRRGIMGGLLLTVLIMWAYFAFMPYFISWSGNVPSGAVWYLRRGVGVWSWVAWLVAATRFVPMFLLLFTTVRTGKRWLLAMSAVVLAGGVPEIAWLVLPSPPGGPSAGPAAALLFIVAVAALGVLWAALLGPAFACAAARAAQPAKHEAAA